jgi:6-phosphogluconolactonase
VDLHVTPSAEAAAADAAHWLARRLRNAHRRRGEVTLAVSGGRTPAAMFAVLATLDVPWAHLSVFHVDERVAPNGDPARNAPLLDVLPLRASQVRLMPVTAQQLGAAAARYARAMPARFDVVHLGIGDDGHTASWPPGDHVVESERTVDLCGTYRGHVRMTLTPRAVNAARARLVLATGPDKAAPVRDWLLHRSTVPVEHLRRTDTVVVLDSEAAALLPLRAD